jgi:outer membrane protein TolC
MTRRLPALAIVVLLATLAGLAPLHAQGGDSLRLGTLLDDAVRRDPRGRQLALLAAQSTLRQRTIAAERLPTLGVVGVGQYQSDVTQLPIRLPDGTSPPGPPHQTYDARLEARQRLWDPSRAPRRDAERAQLAESEARVRVALFGLRQNVNDAYFGALRLQAEREVVENGVADLEAQLRVATERVRRGAALPSEQATLEAELLRRRQVIEQLDADRGAALVVLADLAGRPVRTDDALALPDLAADVARVRTALPALRERPEFAQFASARETLARQRATVAAQDRPRVSAFGRAGYGRPGLNALAREFDEYWIAGVQLEWTPWNWGTTARERELLAIQQQVVATEEAAFAERVRRTVAGDLATIDRLERALASDDTIIALRERILRETRLRFTEGVVTSAEWVDRQTDALAARLARATHRVELAQARARFLTSVGIEVR